MKYLDDKPVSESERRLSEVWVKEGREGEQAERNRIADEKRAEQLKTFNEMENHIIEVT